MGVRSWGYKLRNWNLIINFTSSIYGWKMTFIFKLHAGKVTQQRREQQSSVIRSKRAKAYAGGDPENFPSLSGPKKIEWNWSVFVFVFLSVRCHHVENRLVRFMIVAVVPNWLNGNYWYKKDVPRYFGGSALLADCDKTSSCNATGWKTGDTTTWRQGIGFIQLKELKKLEQENWDHICM